MNKFGIISCIIYKRKLYYEIKGYPKINKKGRKD